MFGAVRSYSRPLGRPRQPRRLELLLSRNAATSPLLLLVILAACAGPSQPQVPARSATAHGSSDPVVVTPTPATSGGLESSGGALAGGVPTSPTTGPQAVVVPPGTVPVDPAVIADLESDELAGAVQPGTPAVAGEAPATAPPVVTPGPTCSPAPPDAAPVPVAYRGPAVRKVVALTFDDGQNAANTQRILDILRRAQVKATFFPTGRAVENNPSGWRAVAAAGFPIANHTYAHRILAGRCYATQLADLTRQRAVLKGVGITSFPVMRPPGGSWDRVTRLAAGGAGEQAVVLWDIDTRDWAGPSAREIARRALAGREGSIILMHTFVANTAAALPSIISGYRARGFTFVTVGTLLGIS